MLNTLIQNMTNQIISRNPEAKQFYESMKNKTPADYMGDASERAYKDATARIRYFSHA